MSYHVRYHPNTPRTWFGKTIVNIVNQTKIHALFEYMRLEVFSLYDVVRETVWLFLVIVSGCPLLEKEQTTERWKHISCENQIHLYYGPKRLYPKEFKIITMIIMMIF